MWCVHPPKILSTTELRHGHLGTHQFIIPRMHFSTTNKSAASTRQSPQGNPVDAFPLLSTTRNRSAVIADVARGLPNFSSFEKRWQRSLEFRCLAREIG